MKRSFALLAAIVCFATAVTALDLRSGLVRITTDDLTLRPMLYRLTDIAGKSKYEPLWHADDPRTSFIVIDIDGRIYRMGSSQEYQTSQKKIANGIEIEYRSIINRVTQRIEFASFAGSRVANGFSVEIEVENYTSRDIKIMLKEVVDTWLGEKSGNHIALASNPKVIDEMYLTPDSKEPYIVSPGEYASVALLFDSEPRPDAVVIANWKRLSDSKFAYDSSLMRGFTLSPYSINDSALGLYWNERIVPAKGVIKVSSRWLTGGPENEFLAWLAENYPPKAEQQTTEAQQNSAEQMSLPALDVEAIRSLLARIDNAIQNVDALSDEDLRQILSEVDSLEQIGANPMPQNQ